MSALLEAKEVTKIYAKAQHPSLNKVSFSVSKSGIKAASASKFIISNHSAFINHFQVPIIA